MRILTNCIFEFQYPKNCIISKFDFFSPNTDVDCIILMFKNIFSSGTIDLMQKYRSMLQSYPVSIPCYVLGISTRIPDRDWNKWQHEGRDIAAKELLDEILKRTSRIGVRGKITYDYLNEILKIDKDRLILLYDNDDSDYSQFMKRLNDIFPDNPFNPWDIYNFQKTTRICNDYVSIDKHIKNIIITQPKLIESYDKIRLSL